MAWLFAVVNVATAVIALDVMQTNAVPAFARQSDLQGSVCHTQRPQLHRFGEQLHVIDFRRPASEAGGRRGSNRPDGDEADVMTEHRDDGHGRPGPPSAEDESPAPS